MIFSVVGEQEYHGLCFAEMQFWEEGCYSLLADDDKNYDISSIDVFLFFNVSEDDEENVNEDSVIQSGNIYYYEKFETSNVGICSATSQCNVENKLNTFDFFLILETRSGTKK